MTLRLALLSVPIALATGIGAQALNAPRYLSVSIQVTMNGEQAEEFSVALFKDNSEVIVLPPCDRSAFQLDLDLNAYYTIRLSKDGFQEKIIAFETHLPDGIEEVDAYHCVVGLDTPDKYTHADPFYLDFPSAVVRWVETTGRFDHSEGYLADIRQKKAPLNAQAGADR